MFLGQALTNLCLYSQLNLWLLQLGPSLPDRIKKRLS